MNKTGQLKTNLPEVIEGLTSISPKLIDEQVKLINDNLALFTAIDALSFEDTENVSLTKYCSKTGQPIGQISVEDYAVMCKINSPGKIKTLLEMKSIEHVAQHWYFTDGESLKNLSEYDPKGYCVYALTSIFAHYQRFLKKLRQADDVTFAGKRKWLDCKITAYQHICNLPLDLIIELNEMMRRYLTLMQSSKSHAIIKWSSTDICENVDNIFSAKRLLSEIRKNIERVVKHEYRNKRLKAHISYADIISIKDIYLGHSNFRQQKKPKEMTVVEMIMQEIQDFIPKSERTGLYVESYVQEPKKIKLQPIVHKKESGGIKLNLSAQSTEPKKSLKDVFGSKK